MIGHEPTPVYSGPTDPLDGKILDLPDVTTITIDDRQDRSVISHLARVTHWQRARIRPAREVIVSGSRPDLDDITWVRIPKWRGSPNVEYSLWCQKELANHVTTPFVLIWQGDGFVLNAKGWTPEFMNYDYVAPSFMLNKKLVGSGGFCLRSKKFCECVRQLPDCNDNEDWFFCVIKRRELEQMGMKFAPIELADRFAFDHRPIVPGTFGFHDNSKTLITVVKYRSRV